MGKPKHNPGLQQLSFGYLYSTHFNGVTVFSWTNFSNGTTVTYSGTYPIRVTDVNSNSLVITSLASLPACSPCPTLTVSISNIIEVNCNGTSTGSFDVTVSGGTSPYSCTLLDNNGNTVASLSGVGSIQNFSGIPAGS